MLAVSTQTGLRVHELTGLTVDQVDLAGGTLLRLKGKGGSIRELPINAPTVALLRAWIQERPKQGAAAWTSSMRGVEVRWCIGEFTPQTLPTRPPQWTSPRCRP